MTSVQKNHWEKTINKSENVLFTRTPIGIILWIWEENHLKEKWYSQSLCSRRPEDRSDEWTENLEAGIELDT